MIAKSRLAYSETMKQLQAAMVDAGNTVFAVIDQAEAAKSAGLSLRPTALIIFGNPKGGTPLMDAHPLFALELPLKILVWDDGESVNLAHATMADLAASNGIEPGDPRVAAMDRALAAIVASVAA